MIAATLLAATLGLSYSCRDEILNEPSTEAPSINEAIGFVTQTDDRLAGTRGKPISDIDELGSMAVFCSATGNSDWTASAACGKMFNIRLNHAAGGAWTYLPGQEVYWGATELSNRYSFFAYTPFAETDKGLTVNGSSSSTGVPTLNYAVPADVLKQPDLMVAKARYNLRPTGYPVALDMQHALACVGFEVLGYRNERVTKIGVAGISVSGQLPIDGNTVAWSNLGAKTTTDFSASLNFDAGQNYFTAKPGMSTGLIKDNGYLMMIPQTLDANAKLNVFLDGESNPRSYQLDKQKWEAGKKVRYQITLKPCEDPTVLPNASTNVSAVAGAPFTITAKGNFTTPGYYAAYQWYSNSSASTSGGTLILGADSASYTAPGAALGTYYYYCMVKNAVCLSDSVAAGPFVVNAMDISAVPAGSGSLSGKFCFDIAFSNDGGSCGTLTSRQAQKADFTLTAEQDPATVAVSAPYSAVQVYTFKPTGTVSNVRFIYIDPSGEVVQSLTPKADYSGNNITSACKATIRYKSTLNAELKGLTSDQALKIDVWAIYNDGPTNNGSDKAVKLSVRFQDCACGCTVRSTLTAAPYNGWITFLCYNLGADPNLSVAEQMSTVSQTATVGVTPSTIYGDLYQWGRTADGHQKRNATTIDYSYSGSFDANGQIPASSTSHYSKFIFATPYNAQQGDWRIPRDQDLWDVSIYPTNNPCPVGWRVPTNVELFSIIDGRTGSGNSYYFNFGTSWTNLPSGNKVRWHSGGTNGMEFTPDGTTTTLFLPAAGRHNSTGHLVVAFSGTIGIYWTSKAAETHSSYHLNFTCSSGADPGPIAISSGASMRAMGYSVRCVANY
jgi:uncharacterized protein (TIGR02145 family)